MGAIKVTVSLNLHPLIREIELRDGRTVGINEIAERSGLSSRTVRRILNKNPRYYDNDTISKLMGYFSSELGRNIEPNEFFVVKYQAI